MLLMLRRQRCPPQVPERAVRHWAQVLVPLLLLLVLVDPWLVLQRAMPRCCPRAPHAARQG